MCNGVQAGMGKALQAGGRHAGRKGDNEAELSRKIKWGCHLK